MMLQNVSEYAKHHSSTRSDRRFTKGLALIQLFSKTCPKLTVAQTAKMSGLTQSAARRFLLTLLHERYLQTDGRYYWLTPKTLRLGQPMSIRRSFLAWYGRLSNTSPAGPKSTPRWGGG